MRKIKRRKNKVRTHVQIEKENIEKAKSFMNKIINFILMVIAIISIGYSIELIYIRRELMLALLEWLRR